jgi:hypothetical protein
MELEWELRRAGNAAAAIPSLLFFCAELKRFPPAPRVFQYSTSSESPHRPYTVTVSERNLAILVASLHPYNPQGGLLTFNLSSLQASMAVNDMRRWSRAPPPNEQNEQNEQQEQEQQK